MNSLSPITRALILANAGIYLVQVLAGDYVMYRMALWPVNSLLFQPWQLVTYGFVHAGFAHLFFNMFALYMFGSEIERVLGARRFLIYYFVSVVGAGLLQMLIMPLLGREFGPMVGASGGVFGVLLAFGMFFPQRRVMLLIPPIPMRAWVFVTLYGLIELAMGVFATQQGVAHFAHLGGMLAGFLLLSFWRNQPKQDGANGW
jgi:membrane associated rhomboid family serine protease